MSILNGKDTVATVPARVVPTNTKNNTDGYSAAKHSDGSNDLTTVFFHGTNFALQVGQQSGAAAPQLATSGSN